MKYSKYKIKAFAFLQMHKHILFDLLLYKRAFGYYGVMVIGYGVLKYTKYVSW